MTNRRTKISPKSGRGLGHVTPTIFGSTVGYPSDSLASCYCIINFCLRDLLSVFRPTYVLCTHPCVLTSAVNNKRICYVMPRPLVRRFWNIVNYLDADDLAMSYLRRPWYAADGQPEKGSAHNELLQALLQWVAHHCLVIQWQIRTAAGKVFLKYTEHLWIIYQPSDVTVKTVSLDPKVHFWPWITQESYVC